jgi:CheY-like chemotaxis protein
VHSDGFAATREIRRRESMGALSTRSFIIALTGNARLEQVQSARDAGVDDVMIKVRVTCWLNEATNPVTK